MSVLQSALGTLGLGKESHSPLQGLDGIEEIHGHTSVMADSGDLGSDDLEVRLDGNCLGWGEHPWMLSAYRCTGEYVEWQRTHTWGGFLWPFPEEEEMGAKHAPLQGEELFEEIDWLLDGDVHPLLVAPAVARTCESIVTVARRHGRPDLVQVFTPYASEEKARRERRAS